MTKLQKILTASAEAKYLSPFVVVTGLGQPSDAIWGVIFESDDQTYKATT